MTIPINNIKENKTNRLILIEWISIIAVFLSCFMFLFYKMEKMEQNHRESLAKQTERTDKLYEMFIDLIKEGRN